MKYKLIFLATFFILMLSVCCRASDWKALHELADKVSLRDAVALADKIPQSAENFYVLGLSYLNVYDTKAAEAAFNRALEINPEFPGGKWGKAEVLRREHQVRVAENMLQELVKNVPEFYPTYIGLAYIEYTKGDYNGSIGLAMQVLNAGPDKVDKSNLVRAYLLVAGNKGMIAHYGGPISKIINGSKVLPNLRKAEKLQPDSAGVLFALGSYYLLIPQFAGRDLEKAQSYLTRAIRLYPLFADTYVRLAQVYQLKKDNRQYEMYLKKALEIDPGNELALDIKGGVCRFICLGAD